ncbi:dihydropteroate synthase [Pedobacter sp. MC2016-14]|uniref:dihydropteroate synthase n=1 Tax=Pedobacter sp. MC2016-14 TaxID=2897327 RepID=UPI001E2C7A5C|nr:dihydropteroate synthase [Pedobacter sp. MC2016-14]MCD0486651.1 dihydropteroate synthase [Pedobacter sp. MC2016-14]
MIATDSFLNQKTTINVKGRLVDLTEPAVMAILNLTPDSFYKNSRAADVEDAIVRTENFLKEGATYIDLGAYSSRPGAVHISVQEEVDRMIPVVEALHKNFPNAILTVDTFRAEVARESIMAGAHIINDIAAGELDEAMFETVAALQVPYMIMHMKGTPQNMQQEPAYENVTLEVVAYFIEKTERLRQLGVKDVILDPGFGFAKSLEHNYELLNHMEDLKIFGLPFLVGFSRKSMVTKPLGIKAAEALNGTSILNTMALLKGASILRVHDVKAAMECITLVQKLQER